MDIKLIAIDLDGTTLKEDKTVSSKTKQVLQAAQARGIIVVPTTGRPKNIIPESIFDIGSIRYIITANGALVFDLERDSTLYSNLMTQRETNNIIEFLTSYGLFSEVYCEGHSYVDKKSLALISTFKDFPQIYIDMIMKSQTFIDDMPGFIKKEKIRIEKINVPYTDPKVYEEVLEKLDGMKEYAITSSFLKNIEINRASANKGEALRHLCKNLGILPQQVMAFGDGSNDLKMLQFAGLSVAMQNGIEPLKTIADFVTCSNEDDGVAYAIEKFVDL